MVDELTPRARMILDAVEREADARRHRLGVRIDPALLTALELGVAGLERSEVADRLRSEQGVDDADRLLDAVFGTGSQPQARLSRQGASA